MNEDFSFEPDPTDAPSARELVMTKQIADLHVLIDTLQTNMRSMESTIKQHDINTNVFAVPSYKWCINWRPGDDL